MEPDGKELLRDVDKLKKHIDDLQARIYHLTYYDLLTQLPNHRKLQEIVSQSFETNPKLEKALIVINLDRFHTINELYGTEVGDQVLIVVSQILKNIFDKGETVYRGLDEMVVFLEDIPYEQLLSLGEKIQNELKQPLAVDKKSFYVSASIGLSHYPSNGCDFETLLRQAEIAMKKAKSQGRGYCEIFQPKDAQKIERTRLIEFALDEVIENKQLYLMYQPKVKLKTGEMYGVEALLRWKHPELGDIAPNELIPLAEETGHIVKIGYWVLEAALKQLRTWHEKGLKLTMAVNISVRQFNDEALIEQILAFLDKHGIDSEYLILEITESVVKDIGQTQKNNKLIEANNLKVAIDDFGTGYSSLRDLYQSSVHSLKIDRSFTWKINQNDRANTLVKMVIETGKTLGVNVLAEGVETKEQIDFLIQNGCLYGQGYYFSEPLPADRISNFNKTN